MAEFDAYGQAPSGTDAASPAVGPHFGAELKRFGREGGDIAFKVVSPFEPTGDQPQAIAKLAQGIREGQRYQTLLGVTGSGKTSVYLSLIDKVLSMGKNVIVMVPEISLTPQTLNLFHKRYGSKTAVFHSALSVGQRADEWKRVKNGEAKIVIGTRSAVFAPLQNIGMIIIDEEQEHTYKSEQAPRYDTKDVARFRCAANKSVLLLASEK